MIDVGEPKVWKEGRIKEGKERVLEVVWFVVKDEKDVTENEDTHFQ